MDTSEPFSMSYKDKTISGPEDLVRQTVAEWQERDRKRAASPWPKDDDGEVDTRAAMTTLCKLFPTLRDEAQGIDPWSADRFLLWNVGSGACRGARHAARFVLSVWNTSTDWIEVLQTEAARPDESTVLGRGLARLRKEAAQSLRGELEDAARDRGRDPGTIVVKSDAVEERLQRWFEAAGPFRASQAMATWDDKHREAFLTWLKDPFFP